MSSFDKCMINLSLNGKIRPGEIKAEAAVYEKRGMAPEKALIRAVEDRLELAEMEVKSINAQVRAAWEAKGGKKAEPVAEVKKLAAPTVEPEPAVEAEPEIIASKRAPTWFSQLERQIAAAKVSTQPGAQWNAWLNANAAKLGIKKEEIEWTGIGDYLTMRGTEKVTKAEIAEYLQANGVQIKEVNKGGRTPDALDPAELIRYTRMRLTPNLSPDDAAELAELKARDDREAEANIKPTKYDKYTIQFGRNYRELLLTLPAVDAVKQAKLDKINARYNAIVDEQGVPISEMTAEARAEIEKLTKEHDEVADDNSASDYHSNHWDEANIVAHVRFNERTNAEGSRVLFIEELQSDWGQAGLKKGFGPKRPATAEETAEWRKLEKLGGAMTPEQSARMDVLDELVAGNGDKVAPAPFVTKTEGWLQLGMKRMVSYAVENDYEKVAFVNGQQSADRYDLSKSVTKIEYASEGGSPTLGRSLVVYGMGGEQLISRNALPDQLADIIGKDIADRLLKAEPKSLGGKMTFHTIAGEGLKIGGDGMIAFYDKIVPQNLRDVLKKLGGGKVETVKINGVEQVGFEVTDAMREKVAEGMPMFSRRQQPVQGQHYLLAGETETEAKRRWFQDYFIRVKVMQDALIAQGGTIGEAQDVNQAEELSYGRVQEQMRDFKNKIVHPLLRDVEKADLTLAELAMYSYAMHAKERNQAMGEINPQLAPGTGSGMTDKEASDILNKFRVDGKDVALAELHERLMGITSTTRQLLLAEGLISDDEFTAWDSKYENYVPLRGFVEDETDVVDGVEKRHGRTAGKGFNIRGAESTRALGRTSLAGHVIENILNDYERAVARVERNDVAKVFLNLVTTNPDAALWEIDAVRTTAAFNKGTQTVTYNQLIDKGEDTVSVKVGGKEVYIKVKDPVLAHTLKQAHTDYTGHITKALVNSVGVYGAYARNTLTRFNPAFGAVNAVKDLGFGALAIHRELGPKGAALYAKHYATSAGANVRNEFGKADASKAVDRQYEEFRAAGGTTGGYHMRDLQEMQKELQNLIVEYGGVPVTRTQKMIATKGVKQAYKAGKATLRILELVGALSENQARFAAFRAAREMGKSPSAAASIAKNLTTNFNRKGEWGTALNSLFIFYNAAVQGSHVMMKIMSSKRGQAALAGVAGLAGGMAVLAAFVGGDDDDGQALWDKIPQFEKERNLIIMLPPGVEMDGATRVGKNGRYIKIPVQYGLNVFTNFGYTVVDLARYANDKTTGVKPTRAALNIVSSIFASFNPFGGAVDLEDPVSIGMAVAPSVADVGIQFGAGVDGFSRLTSPAKSPYNHWPDSENYGPSMAGTWEQRLSAWLNKSTGGDAAVSGKIDLAPGTIRNLNKAVTGGTGAFLSAVLVNIPSKLLSPEGELEHRDIPVLKAFYGEADNSTNLTLYYERKKMAEVEKGNAERRLKKGIPREYSVEEEGLQSLGISADYYTDQMTQLRKWELEIMGDEKLANAEKTLKVQMIKKERGALARAFNADYMNMVREVVK